MKKLLVLLVAFVAVVTFGGTAVIPVNLSKATDVEVPVVMKMAEVLDLVGIDFDANWDSLRIVDERGSEVAYQYVDIDLNNRLSAGDLLVFLAPSSVRITVSEDFDIEAPEYFPVMAVDETDNGWLIISDLFTIEVNRYGLLKVTEYAGVEGTIADEIGIVRVAGWVGSTYYIDGGLGRHEEKTSFGFRIKEVEVLHPGPVAVTVVSRLVSDMFLGLEVEVLSTVFKTGDIVVETNFKFNSYVDMMKLHPMITRPLTDVADDAVHMLPVFRRLAWADQLNITPLEYWLERNAIMYVDRKPYIVFPAVDPMRPFWWGATYIFASQENWRSNYSPSLGIGIAEIMSEKPVVYVDYDKWVSGNMWIYESREFRDGVFRWIPGEFELFEATKGNVTTDQSEWPNRYAAGDSLGFVKYYRLFECQSIEEAVRMLELRTLEIQSISIEE